MTPFFFPFLEHSSEVRPALPPQAESFTRRRYSRETLEKMSSLQDAKVREEFIARCNELHIKAKENKMKLAPPPTNGKHLGRYQAPPAPLSVQTSAITHLGKEQAPYKMELGSQEVQSSFERQFGLINTKSQATPRPSSKASETPSISEPVASFNVPKTATSRPSATAGKHAIAKCHQELAACYQKLAALHVAEAEDAMVHEEGTVKGLQGYLSNGFP